MFGQGEIGAVEYNPLTMSQPHWDDASGSLLSTLVADGSPVVLFFEDGYARSAAVPRVYDPGHMGPAFITDQGVWMAQDVYGLDWPVTTPPGFESFTSPTQLGNWERSVPVPPATMRAAWFDPAYPAWAAANPQAGPVPVLGQPAAISPWVEYAHPPGGARLATAPGGALVATGAPTGVQTMAAPLAAAAAPVAAGLGTLFSNPLVLIAAVGVAFLLLRRD